MNKFFKVMLPATILSSALIAPEANAQTQDVNQLVQSVISGTQEHINNNKTLVNVVENGNNHNFEIPFIIDSGLKDTLNNVIIPNINIVVKDSKDLAREHEEKVRQERAAAEYNATVNTPANISSQSSISAPDALHNQSVWRNLADCESGGNYRINTGNGYYGAYQFSKPTWDSVGGQQFAQYPHQASIEQQTIMAQKLQQRSGWGQWPACTSKLGLR